MPDDIPDRRHDIETPQEAPRQMETMMNDDQHCILVVDDNPVNRKLAAAMLRRLGYRATLVSNGAKAIDELSRGSYSAVLMDCQMPEMNGYQATAEIRKREGKSPRTPIIALTAEAMLGDAEKCLAAGMDDYLSKPVDIHVLGTLLRRWIGEEGNVPATRPSSGPVTVRGTVFDQTKFAELRSLAVGPGQNALAKWTAMFLEDTSSRLPLLRAAIDRGDAHGVEQTAHYLLGASSHVGATAIAALCGELQSLGLSGELHGASVMVEELEAELVRFRTAVDEELQHEEIA